MDTAGFCTQARVLIVAGKGGVGKTTVAATLAQMAAAAGLRALIVEIEGKSGLGAAFGHTAALDYEERELAPNVRARTVTPDFALVEYLEDHGLKRVSKRLSKSGARYSYGETRLGQGRENTKKFLKENPELFEEVRQEVLKVKAPRPATKGPERPSRGPCRALRADRS